MSPDEILQIPRISETKEYRDAVDDIRHAMTEEDARHLKFHLTHELMHHFFAEDSSRIQYGLNQFTFTIHPNACLRPSCKI